MSTHSMLSHDIIYRVQVIEGTNSIHVTCIGIECVDSAVREGDYTLSDLPEWFSDPPTLLIEGVGRRIDEYTYWVYGEDAGEDKN